MSRQPQAPASTIPDHYDAGLGPNMFQDFAQRLAATACKAPIQHALEIAAGTGILSRQLRDALPAQAHLTATDFNPAMLDVAQRKFSPQDRVAFREANAMDLPFEEGQFDLVACQFGVMFFPDKPAAFAQAKRVLKPNGRYVFNVWSAMSENPFSQMAKEVASHYFPDAPQEFYNTPFAYGDPDTVTSDLTLAGWQEVAHETLRITKTITNPEAYANGLVYGNPLINEINERGDIDPQAVVADMRAAITQWFGADNLTMPLSSTTFVCQKLG
ncbi:MAG: class I SAM-dependent methyltransferase [Thalassovita sp.]